MIKKAVTVQVILYSPVYDCSLRSSQKFKMGAAIKALLMTEKIRFAASDSFIAPHPPSPVTSLLTALK